MEFDNGTLYNLSAEYLRIYSPAADSKIRSIGGEKVIIGTTLLVRCFCSLVFGYISLSKYVMSPQNECYTKCDSLPVRISLFSTKSSVLD